MNIKRIVVAVSLLAFSAAAAGIDFGKLLEERINQELNKDKKTQPAPAQAPAPAQSALKKSGRSRQQAMERIDPLLQPMMATLSGSTSPLPIK